MGRAFEIARKLDGDAKRATPYLLWLLDRYAAPFADDVGCHWPIEQAFRALMIRMGGSEPDVDAMLHAFPQQMQSSQSMSFPQQLVVGIAMRSIQGRAGDATVAVLASTGDARPTVEAAILKRLADLHHDGC